MTKLFSDSQRHIQISPSGNISVQLLIPNVFNLVSITATFCKYVQLNHYTPLRLHALRGWWILVRRRCYVGPWSQID